MPPQGSAPRVMTGVAATAMPTPPPIVVDDDRLPVVDRTRVDAAGEPATLILGSADAPGARHQVIFGSDRDEVITGGRGTDRIHGGDEVSLWQGNDASVATEAAAWDALFAGGAEGAGAAPMPMGAALPDLATIDRARANFATLRAPSSLGRDASAGDADGGPVWMTLGARDIAAALAGATATAGASDAMALDGGAMAMALAGSTWSGLGGHDDTAWAASRHVATQHASPWSHVLTPPALLRSLT
jgi:hypothetical protein